jgi:hypothetical protein
VLDTVGPDGRRIRVLPVALQDGQARRLRSPNTTEQFEATSTSGDLHRLVNAIASASQQVPGDARLADRLLAIALGSTSRTSNE